MPTLAHKTAIPQFTGADAAHVSEYKLSAAWETAVTVLSEALDAAPTTVADGDDVSEGKWYAVGIQALVAVTAWSGRLWVYNVDDDEWMRYWGHDYAAESTTFAKHFKVAGFDRAFFQIYDISGTSLDRAVKVL